MTHLFKTNLQKTEFQKTYTKRTKTHVQTPKKEKQQPAADIQPSWKSFFFAFAAVAFPRRMKTPPPTVGAGAPGRPPRHMRGMEGVARPLVGDQIWFGSKVGFLFKVGWFLYDCSYSFSENSSLKKNDVQLVNMFFWGY